MRNNPNDLSALRALLPQGRLHHLSANPGEAAARAATGVQIALLSFVVGVRPNSVTFMQPNCLPMNLILGKTVEN
jgi:hypothetical protein